MSYFFFSMSALPFSKRTSLGWVSSSWVISSGLWTPFEAQPGAPRTKIPPRIAERATAAGFVRCRGTISFKPSHPDRRLGRLSQASDRFGRISGTVNRRAGDEYFRSALRQGRRPAGIDAAVDLDRESGPGFERLVA